MLVKKILTIFENFPKRHFVVILLCLLLLITLSILGNFNFSDEKKETDLSKEIEIEILKQEIEYENVLNAKVLVLRIA